MRRSRLPRVRRPIAIAKTVADERPNLDLALIAFSLALVWVGLQIINAVARAHGAPL